MFTKLQPLQVRHTATVANPQKEKEMRAKAEEQRIRDRENLQRRQVWQTKNGALCRHCCDMLEPDLSPQHHMTATSLGCMRQSTLPCSLSILLHKAIAYHPDVLEHLLLPSRIYSTVSALSLLVPAACQ